MRTIRCYTYIVVFTWGATLSLSLKERSSARVNPLAYEMISPTFCQELEYGTTYILPYYVTSGELPPVHSNKEGRLSRSADWVDALSSAKESARLYALIAPGLES